MAAAIASETTGSAVQADPESQRQVLSIFMNEPQNLSSVHFTHNTRREINFMRRYCMRMYVNRVVGQKKSNWPGWRIVSPIHGVGAAPQDQWWCLVAAHFSKEFDFSPTLFPCSVKVTGHKFETTLSCLAVIGGGGWCWLLCCTMLWLVGLGNIYICPTQR